MPLVVLLLVSVATPAWAQLGHDLEGKQAPIRPGEELVIPMDTEDPSFDLWRTLRDFSVDDREPGLINVQKYDLGFSWFGIPTFFKQPIALTPDDLRAGNVEVAIMGAYADMSLGMRGGAHGPNAFRNSEVYGGWGVIGTPNMNVMVDPFTELVVADYGDAPIDPLSTERSSHAIREFVRQAVEVESEPGKHVMPVIIGGDHSLMYPDVAAVTDVYGAGNVGVVHFDAHYDAGKYAMGHLINHGDAGISLDRGGPGSGRELHPGGAPRLLPGRRGVRVDAR